MKKILRIAIEFTLSWFIAYGVLNGILYLLEPQKSKIAEPKLHKVLEQKVLHKDIIKDNRQILSCLKNAKSILEENNCFKKKKQSKNLNVKNVTKIEKKEKKDDMVIFFLYQSMVLMLAVALTIFIENRIFRQYSEKMVLLLDYAIKVPPTFGVAGTIYSLAIFASKSTSANGIVEVFKENIANAVGTTLLGIFVYALAGLVFIALKEYSNEKI